MDENTEKSGTTPPEPTHEATTPPENPPVDEEALRKSEETLEQPGAGH
ncbi:MAG TPA: hypothetical protein VGR12_07305 [Solirubrobacteraceae bacterium]|nr:hypothetical protein [Solirubrobacteraceae bacterium]